MGTCGCSARCLPSAIERTRRQTAFGWVTVSKGVEQGIEKGLAQGKQDMMIHLLERCLARPLSSEEQTRVLARVESVGPNSIGDLAFDLSPEALERMACRPQQR